MGKKHRRRLNDRLNQLESNPFREPIFADHTDEYPDPPAVNGHVPDYVFRDAFGEVTVGEVEKRGDTSQHTRDQRDTFEAFDTRGPQFDNETVFYDDEDEDRLFDLF